MSDKKLYMFTVGAGYEAQKQSDYPLTALWKGFTENTTAHGIPHIKHARGPIKITFWSLVSACCLGLLLYNIYLQTVQYTSHDVKVRVQMKFERKITFPAISVCNHNPILKSRLGKTVIKDIIASSSSDNASETATTRRKKRSANSRLESTTSDVTLTTTTAGNIMTSESRDRPGDEAERQPASGNVYTEKVKAAITGNNPASMENMEAMHVDEAGRPIRDNYALKLKVMKAVADMDIEEKKALGYDIETLILDCDYRGYQCFTERDFTSFYNTMYGNCYTFNSGWNESRELEFAYRPGPQYGLALTLNMEVKEYIGDLAESVGVRVVVHPQDRMPFPEDEGISAAPGELTYVAISMLTVDRLSEPYGECLEGVEDTRSINVFQELYPVNYSTSACYKTCYQKHVIQRCLCGDSQYPFHGEAFNNVNVSACDPSNNTQVECKASVTSDYQAGRLPCKCPLACSEKSYTLSSSDVPWPSDDYKLQLFKELASANSNISKLIMAPGKWDYTENLAKIVVYFKELNYQHIQETPAYDGGSFLSDVGGILGLYLGFSLMTIMEFVEVSLDVIALMFLKFSMHKRTHLDPVKESAGDCGKTNSDEMSAAGYDVKKVTGYFYAKSDQQSPLPGQID